MKKILFVDDENFWHAEAAIGLKKIGYNGELTCFYNSADFFKNTTESDRQNALIVVDFDLCQEDALEAQIAQKIRADKNFQGKIVLCSMLKKFGEAEDQEIAKHYDRSIRKTDLSWRDITLQK